MKSFEPPPIRRGFRKSFGELDLNLSFEDAKDKLDENGVIAQEI